jgi:hypothetical protein
MRRFNLILLCSISIPVLWVGACSTSVETESNLSQIPIQVEEDQDIGYNPNHPEDIKKHGIFRLVVQNSLENSQCFEDEYKFNDCGEVEYHHPAMVATVYKYKYDSACRLINMSAGFVDYNYKYLGNDSVQEDVFDNLSDSVPIWVSSTRFKQRSIQDPNSIYDDEGNVMEERMGKLIYPCGIEYPGEHRAVHFYKKNGLKDFVQIFDSLDKVIVEEKYLYYGKDNILLNFND